MERICIVTDSTADLTKEMKSEYNIIVLPLIISYNGKNYKDGEDVDIETVLTWMENGQLPKTSQINPHMFAEAYEKLLKSYDKIISIHIASDLSGTYQSACIAKDMIDSKKIYVIDSKSVSFGTGLLVLKAAQMLKEGKSAEEIVSGIESIKGKVRVAFFVNSLEYLKKGGRISSVAATIGSVLDIKPIVYSNEGKLDILDKVRGTRKAMARLLKYFQDEDFDETQKFCVGNVGQKDSGEAFAKLINDKLNIYNFYDITVGATVAVYAGRGTVGIFFFVK